MGIQGLLPVLKCITDKTHLRNFKGKTAAVDGYSWLHKGTYCCSTDICLDGDASRCIAYCMKRVNLLMFHGIKPIIVFDGGALPMKQGTEKDRRESREKYMKMGKELREVGDFSAAEQAFSKAVDVTPNMAKEFMDRLDEKGVDYVVAPYEADAQMAYLSINGVTDLTISEDSDCLVFGCRKVLFKLENDGSGELIDASRICHVRRPINLIGFTKDMFLDMCILSGCDYLESVRGMGLKNAASLVRKYKHPQRILKGLRFEGTYLVPQNYELEFFKARLTFRHHRVYAYGQKELGIVPLTPFPDRALLPKLPELVLECDQYNFCGPWMDPETVHGIGIGKLHPVTKQKFLPEYERKMRLTEDTSSSATNGSYHHITQAFAHVDANWTDESRMKHDTKNPFVTQSKYFGNRKIMESAKESSSSTTTITSHQLSKTLSIDSNISNTDSVNETTFKTHTSFHHQQTGLLDEDESVSIKKRKQPFVISNSPQETPQKATATANLSSSSIQARVGNGSNLNITAKKKKKTTSFTLVSKVVDRTTGNPFTSFMFTDNATPLDSSPLKIKPKSKV